MYSIEPSSDSVLKVYSPGFSIWMVPFHSTLKEPGRGGENNLKGGESYGNDGGKKDIDFCA